MKKCALLPLLFLACHEPVKQQPKTPSTPVVVKTIIDTPKVISKSTVPIREAPPPKTKDFLPALYDSLLAFHTRAAVYDSVAENDFAEKVVRYVDTVMNDSSIKVLRVRSDYEDSTVYRLFVRYEYQNTIPSVDEVGLMMFLIWREPLSQRVRWQTFPHEIEYRPDVLKNEKGFNPITASPQLRRSDIRRVMEFMSK